MNMETNKNPEVTAAWKIIDEECNKYGGFVNVITKCGGTLVSQIWIKSMEDYATIKTSSLQKTIDQQAEEIAELKQAADNMKEAFAEIISLDNAQNRATFEDDFYENR